MARLPRSDLEAVVAFAATAAAATADGDARRRWVIEHIAELIPCDAGSYVATDGGTSIRGSTRWWGACPVVHEHSLEPTSGRIPPAAPGLFELHRRHNPYYHHFRQVGVSNAVRVSDIADVAAYTG